MFFKFCFIKFLVCFLILYSHNIHYCIYNCVCSICLLADDFSPCRIDAKIDEADNSRQSREASPKFTGMQLLDVDNKPAEFLDEATTPIKFGK